MYPFERVEVLYAKVMFYDENDLPIYNFIFLPEVPIMKIMIELAVLRQISHKTQIKNFRVAIFWLIRQILSKMGTLIKKIILNSSYL